MADKFAAHGAAVHQGMSINDALLGGRAQPPEHNVVLKRPPNLAIGCAENRARIPFLLGDSAASRHDVPLAC